MMTLCNMLQQAEDCDTDVVLRLYEAFGGSTSVTVSTTLPVKQALLYVVYAQVFR